MTGSRRETLRLDRLLVNLRFARTRSRAQTQIETGHMRLNGERVLKPSREVGVGDVITLAYDETVMVVRIEKLPQRRLAPAEAARGWVRVA